MNTIEELISDIKAGKMVILVDDEERENEGDIVLAADHVTPEKINFMAKFARGLICLSLTPEQTSRLQLALMVGDEANHSPHKTAFTVSVEAASGVSTGISAADRAHTIRVASHPQAKPEDVIMPGHIFPIRAQKGGVLKRPGHTEGSVELAKLAGLNPAAVICEVMNDDGSMARLPDLQNFAKQHDLKIGTIVDLIDFRLRTETLIQEVPVSEEQARVGEAFSVKVFQSLIDGSEHIALVHGEISAEPTLVRVQSGQSVGDFLSSFFSNQGKVARSAKAIQEAGSGVLLFMQTQSSDDMKDYGLGAQILRHLGLQQIRLLTRTEQRRTALRGYGLEIIETVDI